MQTTKIINNKFKKFEDFETVGQLSNKEAKSNHAVIKVKKKPKKPYYHPKQEFINIWYAKKVSSLAAALRELIAQEFLRLFYPHQPKTRIAIAENRDIYILSKEVPVFKPIEVSWQHIQKGIREGKYTGLGILLILALIINEIDLKSGNLGKDKDNHFIKIDGDHCLLRFIKNYPDFTAKDIANLPFITDYYAFNWLDVISEGEATKSGLAKDFKEIPKLKAEIHTTILAVLLLSDIMVNKFVDSYSGNNDLAKQLTQARDRLLSCVLENNDFRNFLTNINANLFIDTISELFSKFQSMGKTNPFQGINIQEVIRNEWQVISRILKLNDELSSNPKTTFTETHSSLTKRPREEADTGESTIVNKFAKHIHEGGNVAEQAHEDKTLNNLSIPAILQCEDQAVDVDAMPSTWLMHQHGLFPAVNLKPEQENTQGKSITPPAKGLF